MKRKKQLHLKKIDIQFQNKTVIVSNQVVS